MVRALHLALLRVYRRLPTPWRLRVIHVLAPTFTVGAICVVDRGDGHILLVRHSYRDRWGFPGGLLKRGEEPDAGARRESLEEVGLDVELLGPPVVVVAPDSRRVDLIYRARPADGADLSAVRPSSPEIVEARWVPGDDLPELQHEAAGALVALARALP
jgi:ADP-ribose pyrophosphatase YjhB (NUDIX family)